MCDHLPPGLVVLLYVLAVILKVSVEEVNYIYVEEMKEWGCSKLKSGISNNGKLQEF